MDKKKVRKFVREHKKELIVGAGFVLGTVACVIVGKSLRTSKDVTVPAVKAPEGFQILNNIKDIEVPEGFSVGKTIDLFEDGDEIVAIVQDLTVNDLGKFGKELIKYGFITDGAEGAITAEFLRNV